ncbi:hypothetical protein Dsin_009066 [Dipteronia sinensis]|uniref:Uncharacterized protein n=1 Tax=Dipteronia sinensis TaxID=43782 RepID=A0AAE0APT4_9ROSI|nr:hypothetical protein Dsin_009066 [Dipteronia sinensis]
MLDNVPGGGEESLDRLGFQVGKKLDILFCVFVGFWDLFFWFVLYEFESNVMWGFFNYLIEVICVVFGSDYAISVLIVLYSVCKSKIIDQDREMIFRSLSLFFFLFYFIFFFL